jgi:hypothetical protein
MTGDSANTPDVIECSLGRENAKTATAATTREPELAASS